MEDGLAVGQTPEGSSSPGFISPFFARRRTPPGALNVQIAVAGDCPQAQVEGQTLPST